MVDPYRAPRPEPPPPRDVMRIVLFVAGGLAGLIAATAIAFYVIEQQQAHAAKSAPPLHPIDVLPTTSHQPPNTKTDDTCCAHGPVAYCPQGVEPTCERHADGTCSWKIPPNCGFEPPCRNGGIAPLCIPPDGGRVPPERGRYPQLNELLDTR